LYSFAFQIELTWTRYELRFGEFGLWRLLYTHPIARNVHVERTYVVMMTFIDARRCRRRRRRRRRRRGRWWTGGGYKHPPV
jgi:hypothetical protein